MATVVIADDSPTLRRIVTSVLTREGHEVVAAEDGIQAVQAVFRVQPDVIVLDVQMPRVSGYVAARLLKEDWQTSHIPIVMLTSLDSASDRYWGAQTGADRYLTKDFEAPELAAAVSEVIEAATRARGGRPPIRPDALELTDDDVLSRVCDLLDRKLFEAAVAAEMSNLATSAHGLEQTVSQVLGVLQRFVDNDLAAVLLDDERSAFVAVDRETSQEHYDEFLTAAADALSAASGTEVPISMLSVRLSDERHLLGEDEDGRMATFLSMPLRGHGGRFIGVLALSSAVKNAFSETALATLRIVEGPAAIVVENARLASVRHDLDAH
jgi:twitching motility two-component system response regulator PilH